MIKEAAVLVPVYRDTNGNIRVVLIRRSPHGIHGNQIALPGGKLEVFDETPLSAALREAEEEIGIDERTVTVLSALPPVEITVSGYRIYPFLAQIEPPASWRYQEAEVAEVIDIMVSELLRPEAHSEELWVLPGCPEPRLIPFYRIGSYKLWGATYRILQPVLPEILTGKWKI